MNESDLSKIDDFFSRKHKEATSSALEPPSEEVVEYSHLDPSRLEEESRIPIADSRVSYLRGEDDLHLKCLSITKTKWDKFAPYAFNKLEKEKKVQTFLQLFEDFNLLKHRLNEELDKNKRMTAKLVFLDGELAKAKTSNSLSPAERLRLEKEQNQETQNMKLQIKRLHEKIIALTGNSHKIGGRPRTANKTKGTAHKNIVAVNENVRSDLEAERKQVRELLLIIDELKKNKYELEDQLKQKQKNQQSSLRGDRNVSKVSANRNTDSQFNEWSNDLMNWKQKYNDLQLIFNRAVEDKDTKIRQLASELTDLKENERMKSKLERRGGHFDISETGRLEEKIKDLGDENEKLEGELRRLVKMPFYQNNTQIIDQQQKISELEVKYNRAKDDLKISNDTSMKYFAELEYKTKENSMLKEQNEKMKKQLRANFEREQSKAGGSVAGQIDYDDYYRRQLALVKLEGDDPVWRKFSLLSKPEFQNMTESQLREESNKLWSSKLELLAHLEKAHIELACLKENVDSRVNMYIRDKQYLEEELRVTRARLDEWMSMERMNVRRDFQVYEQAGIKYDDTTSVFEVEESEVKELESNENYFDLYLGHISIDESMLLKNPQNKIKNVSHFVSFVTVDFFNHETQHSDFAEGVMKKLGNNYSFRVEVNTYFLKYLSKNAINLELWSPQGTATVLLGKGKIYLSQLISKATKDISNVIRGKCQIYFNDKLLIASVEYRIRMRLPISPFVEWAESKNQFKHSIAKNPLALGKKKILAISVDRAEGLPPSIKAFVYFSIQNEDFFTEPERGPAPLWDFHCEVPVTLDEEFSDELKQKYFEFTVFDDEKEVNEDVYGIARASLTPLVDSVESLSLELEIENPRGESLGRLKIRAEWMNG